MRSWSAVVVISLLVSFSSAVNAEYDESERLMDQCFLSAEQKLWDLALTNCFTAADHGVPEAQIIMSYVFSRQDGGPYKFPKLRAEQARYWKSRALSQGMTKDVDEILEDWRKGGGKGYSNGALQYGEVPAAVVWQSGLIGLLLAVSGYVSGLLSGILFRRHAHPRRMSTGVAAVIGGVCVVLLLMFFIGVLDWSSARSAIFPATFCLSLVLKLRERGGFLKQDGHARTSKSREVQEARIKGKLASLREEERNGELALASGESVPVRHQSDVQEMADVPEVVVEEADGTNEVSQSNRISEAEAYSAVWEELESGGVDKAVWAQCFESTEGDENKAKAMYIRIRRAVLSGGGPEGSMSKDT